MNNEWNKNLVGKIVDWIIMELVIRLRQVDLFHLTLDEQFTDKIVLGM